ncbi:DUF5994 family protein [Nonomuraea africana]|uniref:DUF5994 family protein n=1 Tax=Nonomuraea africana TaxID=46171 RepID=UPI0033D7C7D9
MMPNHTTELADVRLLLEPTESRDGLLHGAWWPRSHDLRRELGGLVTELGRSLGPILRVRVDHDAWNDVPSSLMVSGRFLRVGDFPSPAGTITVIRGDQDGFLLLVVPPETTAARAASLMVAAARADNGTCAADLLARGDDAEETPPAIRLATVRDYRRGDEMAVLALINADRLPGQPLCSPEMLAAAVQGTCADNPAPWAELDPPRTQVMIDHSGDVVGVISYTTRARDAAGLILWLHGRENVSVIEPLVERALGCLASRAVVHAFTVASALTSGLGALPSIRRPVTRKVLEHAGFSGRESWRYLHRGVRGLGLAQASQLVRVASCLRPSGWWLSVDEHEIGVEAVAGTPSDGVGVLWWLGTDTAHDDAALDKALLDRALALLYANGAREIVLYAEGEPLPARSLFDTAGFVDIDHLASYARG